MLLFQPSNPNFILTLQIRDFLSKLSRIYGQKLVPVILVFTRNAWFCCQTERVHSKMSFISDFVIFQEEPFAVQRPEGARLQIDASWGLRGQFSIGHTFGFLHGTLKDKYIPFIFKLYDVVFALPGLIELSWFFPVWSITCLLPVNNQYHCHC